MVVATALWAGRIVAAAGAGLGTVTRAPADYRRDRRPADRRVRRRDTLAPITASDPAFDVAAALRRAARDRGAPRRRRLAARRPQDRLHEPHDLAALRRLSADVGARLGAHRPSAPPPIARRSRSRRSCSRGSSPRSCSARRRPSRSTAMRAPCSPASTGSRPASRSCRAISRTGSSPPPIARRRSGCTARSSSARLSRLTERNRAALAAALPTFALTLRRDGDADRHRRRRQRPRQSGAGARASRARARAGSRSSRRSPPARSSRPARSPTRGPWRRARRGRRTTERSGSPA